MAVNTIVEILRIKTEKDLMEALENFETTVTSTFKPLSDKLAQQLLTSEVQQLELHMTFVESWRDRVAKALMLATAFEQHAKSHLFLPPLEKGKTATDREAYLRDLAATGTAMVVYLEQKLRTIDSRVNICKKLLGNEQEGATNKRFV